MGIARIAPVGPVVLATLLLQLLGAGLVASLPEHLQDEQLRAFVAATAEQPLLYRRALPTSFGEASPTIVGLATIKDVVTDEQVVVAATNKNQFFGLRFPSTSPEDPPELLKVYDKYGGPGSQSEYLSVMGFVRRVHSGTDMLSALVITDTVAWGFVVRNNVLQYADDGNGPLSFGPGTIVKAIVGSSSADAQQQQKTTAVLQVMTAGANGGPVTASFVVVSQLLNGTLRDTTVLEGVKVTDLAGYLGEGYRQHVFWCDAEPLTVCALINRTSDEVLTIDATVSPAVHRAPLNGALGVVGPSDITYASFGIGGCGTLVALRSETNHTAVLALGGPSPATVVGNVISWGTELLWAETFMVQPVCGNGAQLLAVGTTNGTLELRLPNASLVAADEGGSAVMRTTTHKGPNRARVVRIDGISRLVAQTADSLESFRLQTTTTPGALAFATNASSSTAAASSSGSWYSFACSSTLSGEAVWTAVDGDALIACPVATLQNGGGWSFVSVRTGEVVWTFPAPSFSTYGPQPVVVANVGRGSAASIAIGAWMDAGWAAYPAGAAARPLVTFVSPDVLSASVLDSAVNTATREVFLVGVNIAACSGGAAALLSAGQVPLDDVAAPPPSSATLVHCLPLRMNNSLGISVGAAGRLVIAGSDTGSDNNMVRTYAAIIDPSIVGPAGVEFESTTGWLPYGPSWYSDGAVLLGVQTGQSPGVATVHTISVPPSTAAHSGSVRTVRSPLFDACDTTQVYASSLVPSSSGGKDAKRVVLGCAAGLGSLNLETAEVHHVYQVNRTLHTGLGAGQFTSNDTVTLCDPEYGLVRVDAAGQTVDLANVPLFFSCYGAPLDLSRNMLYLSGVMLRYGNASTYTLRFNASNLTDVAAIRLPTYGSPGAATRVDHAEQLLFVKGTNSGTFVEALDLLTGDSLWSLQTASLRNSVFELDPSAGLLWATAPTSARGISSPALYGLSMYTGTGQWAALLPSRVSQATVQASLYNSSSVMVALLPNGAAATYRGASSGLGRVAPRPVGFRLGSGTPFPATRHPLPAGATPPPSFGPLPPFVASPTVDPTKVLLIVFGCMAVCGLVGLGFVLFLRHRRIHQQRAAAQYAPLEEGVPISDTYQQQGEPVVAKGV